uniref:MOG interacting and ectopic P-granules protein 1 n=1 Tax=Anopheles triannulatus TaxID=58253 RepID=A0A2M4A7M3_9DIPT
MGEVGANATDTTASELKENGELNGGTTTTLAAEATTGAADAAAILLPKTKKVVDSKELANATNEDDAGAQEGKGKLGDRQPNDSAVEQTEKANAEDQASDGLGETQKEAPKGQAAEDSSMVPLAAPSSEKKAANAADGEDDENADRSADAQQAGTSLQKETSKQTSSSKRQRSHSRSSDNEDSSKIQKKQQAGVAESSSSNGSVNGEGGSGSSQVVDDKKDRRRTEAETTGGVIELDLDDTIPEEEEPMEVDEATEKGEKEDGGVEGQSNGKSREEDRNQSKAVVAVSRTKEGEKENESTTAVSSSTVTNGHQKDNEPKAAAKSSPTGEPMEQDEEEEEEDEDEEDDDKPVSINSDSDGEEQQQPKPKVNEPAKQEEVAKGSAGLIAAGGGGVLNAAAGAANGVVANADNRQQVNGDCDGDVTILSDKEEDCVVIEDDEMDGEDVAGGAPPPQLPPTPTTPLSLIASRRSKARRSAIAPSSPMVAITPVGISAAQQQQHTSGHQDSTDDEDDDIQEIIEDPLSMSMPSIPMAHSRGSGSLAMGSPIGAAGGFTAAGAYKPQKSLLMNSTGSAGKDQASKLMLIDTMDGGAAGRPTVGAGNSVSLLAGSKTHNSTLSGGSMATIGMSTVGQNVPFNATTLGNSRSLLNSTTGGGTAGAFQKNGTPSLAPVTPLLPALTDDMFVLEAPSFIVPYIYEKPPVDNLRDIVDDLEAKIKEMRKKLEEETGASGGGSAEQKAAAAATAAESALAAEDASKKDAASAALDANEAAGQKDSTADSKKRKRPANDDDDDEWDELDTSTDDEASDEEQKTKVLIKEAKADIETFKEHIISPSEKDDSGSGGTGSGGAGGDASKKSENYFENPLGKFFMNIGINLVQEFVQTDLLRQQKRKRDREGKPSPSTQLAINSLMKNLEQSKENNKPYKFEMKRCEYCPFRSESALVMAHHYETPHMRNFIYKCNFCSYETRPPHDILYHMEAVHNIKGRMEKALSYHHCPNCPFEDNGKSKLARHAVACAKKFRPEINLNPPMDWEPPAKIPRIKPKHGLVGTATAYQAMTAQQQKNLALANQQRINQVQQHQSVQHLTQQQQQHLTAHQLQQQQQSLQSLTAAQQQQLVTAGLNSVNLANLSPAAAAQAAALRGRMVGGNIGAGIGGTGMTGGRAPSIISSPTGISSAGANVGMRGVVGGGLGNVGVNAAAVAASAALRNTLVGAGMVIPNNLQLSASATALAAAAAAGLTKYAPNSISAGRSLLANTNASITIQNATGMKTTKAAAQPPSISITPLPRQSSSNNSNAAAASMTNIAGALSKLQAQGTSAVKPGQSPTGGGKTAFVVCEICDGYIKDLDQLRNHMQWIHKVKIHPKMIYNRPPLNCQKCQYRFFTDQGLERHLLGSHGLVTSSMQEAANKGKDAGRCPVCGRVYQWKLLNHVSRDHNMTLKPAHLSYKCTVCTATFGMYKQFESHVYSAHSTVAKKSVDGKSKGGGGGGGGGSGMQQSATNLSTTGDRSGATSSRGVGSSGFVGSGDSLLKPLKINDEITIIPQPSSNKIVKTIDLESHVID